MINPLVVESLTVNNTTRRWNILYVKFVPNNFKECDGSTQIFCTIRLADHGTKPGTAIQCKTKGSSCHRESSVRVLSVIRAAQSYLLTYSLTTILSQL
jgi:hypothetical protein